MASAGRFVASLTLALAACPSSSFEEHVPRSLPGAPAPAMVPAADARAAPPPLFAVRPTGAFDDRPVRATVRARAADGGVETVDLALLAADGTATDQTASIAYRLGAPLPFEVGRSLWLKTASRGLGTGLTLWGILDGEGAPPVLALASINDGLPGDALAGVTVAVGDALAYSEVRTLASGCTVAVDHFALEARTSAGVVVAPPGTIRRVDVDGEAWNLTALDASRPSARGPATIPGCPSGAHVSWVLVRARAPEP